MAQAKQSIPVAGTRTASRSTKLFRSKSDRNIFRRSIPRTITWCSAPGESILAFRGMEVDYHRTRNFVKHESIDVPIPLRAAPMAASKIIIEGIHWLRLESILISQICGRANAQLHLPGGGKPEKLPKNYKLQVRPCLQKNAKTRPV